MNKTVEQLSEIRTEKLRARTEAGLAHADATARYEKASAEFILADAEYWNEAHRVERKQRAAH